MNPTLSDVHVDTLLTNFSVAYWQEGTNFVAGRVFPEVPVVHASDKYQTYSRADFNRNVMRKRAPSTESAGGGYKVGTASYTTDVWAFHKDIDDQIRANADSNFSLDSEATRFLVNQALISREVDWAASYFAGSIWTGLLTGVAAAPGANQALQWNDPNSNPISDIRTVQRNMQLTSGGFRGNKLVLGRVTFDTLIDHPDFVDRVKYGQTPNGPALVNMQALASMLEVDEVLVMDAIQNTGPEGTTLNAFETNAFIGNSKAALLLYVAPRVGLQTPTAGVTFTWTGFLGATSNGTRIKSFYMDAIASTRVEIEQAYDQALISADLGVWFASIVA